MIRIVSTTNLDELIAMRMEVLQCVFGGLDALAYDQLRASNIDYYRRRLADGSHIAALAYAGDALAGSGAACLYDEMPSPDNRSGRCAYIMNVYVRPAYRRHGIAASIVDWLVAQSCSRGAEKIYLESTDEARELYAQHGFHDMINYMKYEDDRN